MLYNLGLVVGTYSVDFGYRLACETGFYGPNVPISNVWTGLSVSL